MTVVAPRRCTALFVALIALLSSAGCFRLTLEAPSAGEEMSHVLTTNRRYLFSGLPLEGPIPLEVACTEGAVRIVQEMGGMDAGIFLISMGVIDSRRIEVWCGGPSEP